VKNWIKNHKILSSGPYIQGVWPGSIHVLKSSFSIVCVVYLLGISTVVEKIVDEMVFLLRFFMSWTNKKVQNHPNWPVTNCHPKQLGLDPRDE